MRGTLIYDHKNTSTTYHLSLFLSLNTVVFTQTRMISGTLRKCHHHCFNPVFFTQVKSSDSGAPAGDGLVHVWLSVIDTGDHSLLMRHNANQCCYLSLVICFQLRHITRTVISALFMSDFQHAVRKHGTKRHKSAQITLNLFLSVLVLLKDFLK